MEASDDAVIRVEPLPRWLLPGWSFEVLNLDGVVDGILAARVIVRANDPTVWAGVRFAVRLGASEEHLFLGSEQCQLPPLDEALPIQSSMKWDVLIGAVRFRFLPVQSDGIVFSVERTDLATQEGLDCLATFVEWVAFSTSQAVTVEFATGDDRLDIDVRPPDRTHYELVDAVHVAALRNPRFIERDDMIFLSHRYDPDNVREWAESLEDPAAIESVVNHTHLYDEIHSVDDDDILVQLGHEIVQIWGAVLRREFPNREVVVELEPDDYGPTIYFSRP